MREVGIDISDRYPGPWTDEAVGAADVVVTMGCGDACPGVPGTRSRGRSGEDRRSCPEWDLEDPAGRDTAAVHPIRDETGARVRALTAELGVEPPPV